MKYLIFLSLVFLGCGPRSLPGYQYWPPEAQGKAR